MTPKPHSRWQLDPESPFYDEFADIHPGQWWITTPTGLIGCSEEEDARTILGLVEQLEAALKVAEAAKTYRDVRGDYTWVQMIQALDAWEHPNPASTPVSGPNTPSAGMDSGKEAVSEQRFGEWERMEERRHSVESSKALIERAFDQMHDDALARAEKAEARVAELEAALREAEQLMHDAQSAEAWHVLQRALGGGEA